MTTSIDRNLIVIVGATGSGKTDLSIRVAQHFKAPILSADSRQLFKGMPIGTAQPTVEQLETVQHYFIATQELSTLYTCGQYEKEALELLGKLFLKYQVVVLVGGSGLYIDALCNGMDNLPASDPALRASLVERYEQYGLANLTEELRHLDPDYYSQVDLNNPNRVMRALEVCLQTGRPYSQQRSGRRIDRNFRIIKIGTHRPREILYERINRRVDQMMK